MRIKKNLSFKHKLAAAFLIAAIIPLILCSIIMTRILKTSLLSQSKESANDQIDEAQRKLDELFLGFENVSEKVSESVMLKKSLIDNSAYESDIFLSLYKISAELSLKSDLSLYDGGGKVKYSTNEFRAITKLPTDWGLLKKASKKEKTVYYNIEDFTENKSYYTMNTGRTLLNSKGALFGYVVISIPEETLSKSLAGMHENQSFIYLLDETGRLVYYSGSSEVSQSEIDLLRENILLSGRSYFEDESSQFYMRKHESSGYYLIMKRANIINTATMEVIRNVAVITGAISIILCLAFSVFLSRNLSRPVSLLSEAMTKVRNVNLEIRIETKGSDEFGQLTEDFNRMTSELEEYVERTIAYQREKNRTQLRLLQSQLNPHFLYNTLDTIKWLGKMYKVPDISEICSSLAIILRESISGDQFVILRKEFTTLQNYVNIQKIRFCDKFEYREDLDEELEEYLIPKLVLQPLVENSIVHGLSDRESGIISVTAKKDGEDLLIMVYDNGHGMAPDMMEILNKDESKMLDGHLGLYNVNHIIKINYGNKYGLKTETSENGGTLMKMKIPLIRREDYV